MLFSQMTGVYLDLFAEEVFSRQLELMPELLTRYPANGREKSIEDIKHTVEYLKLSYEFDAGAIFNDYISWLGTILETRGVPLLDLKVNLNVLDELFASKLSAEEYPHVQSYIKLGVTSLDNLVIPYESTIDDSSTAGITAKKYLDFLLEGNKAGAFEIIMFCVKDGMNIRNIYKDIFIPVQYEIGRLWQINKISVASEHYSTALTQMIMSQLNGHFFNTKKKNYRMVAICIGSEMHEIGLRMVVDNFEMDGWNTYYLGANTPIPGVINMLEKVEPHVLAISVTLFRNLRNVKDMITHVRGDYQKNLKIIVGGSPFSVVPDLYKKVGADGYAATADQAIELAETLMLE